MPRRDDTQDVVATRDLERTPSTLDPQPGPLGQLGRFQLQEVLGQGGFGTVYKAYDPTLERIVALKVPRQTADPSLARNVLEEAKAAARLRHPHIVQIYETGQAGSAHYIASEFIEGMTLSVWLQRGVPKFKMAVRWARDLAKALAHAHGEGIVHRDVKPANVMLDAKKRPLLMDFGLALRSGRDGKEGGIVGTPAYMAPEQARGEMKNIGPAADQYAL